MSGLLPLITLLDATTPDSPPDDKVVAGKVAFVLFLALIIVVVLLGLSLVKQFRKVNAARDAGLYDESRKEREAREKAEAEEREALSTQSQATDSD